jgi:hypothetical protein
MSPKEQKKFVFYANKNNLISEECLVELKYDIGIFYGSFPILMGE